MARSSYVYHPDLGSFGFLPSLFFEQMLVELSSPHRQQMPRDPKPPQLTERKLNNFIKLENPNPTHVRSEITGLTEITERLEKLPHVYGALLPRHGLAR